MFPVAMELDLLTAFSQTHTAVTSVLNSVVSRPHPAMTVLSFATLPIPFQRNQV